MVVADINADGAQKVADGITGEGGTALALPVDVSDPVGQGDGRPHASAEFGGIDYLVNNAAIFGGMKLDFLVTVDPDYYKKFMSVNLDGALWCTRAVYKKMAKRGGGAIVNQSSTAAWLYSNFYGLAKVGINGLTHSCPVSWAARTSESTRSRPAPSTPRPTAPPPAGDGRRHRQGSPAVPYDGNSEDLVGMCLFLLSDQANWITGQIFNVDGGQIIRS